ncbi:hypothetical protein C8J56DRAFT_897143 [Mycena floridula]|nr:hypothetical protein C8J56DRAFT_897143 [Mycena floridula]
MTRATPLPPIYVDSESDHLILGMKSPEAYKVSGNNLLVTAEKITPTEVLVRLFPADITTLRVTIGPLFQDWNKSKALWRVLDFIVTNCLFLKTVIITVLAPMDDFNSTLIDGITKWTSKVPGLQIQQRLYDASIPFDVATAFHAGVFSTRISTSISEIQSSGDILAMESVVSLQLRPGQANVVQVAGWLIEAIERNGLQELEELSIPRELDSPRLRSRLVRLPRLTKVSASH